MALQLNPTVADPFEQLPLYQFRRNIFDALGFVYSTASNGSTFEVPFFADAASFGQLGPLPATDGNAALNTPNSLVYEIKQRLGLPNALGIKIDNLGTLLTQLSNFIGLGAMIKFLPGNVVPLLTAFINQAEQDLWRDIELDSGGAATGSTLLAPPTRMGTAAVTASTASFTIAAIGSTQTVVVSSGTGFAPNVANTGISVTDGQYALTGLVTAVAGTSITVKTVSIDAGFAGATMATNAMVAYGSTCTLDSTAIMQRAIALAKDHYGQDDGQLYMEQSKKYVADYARRSPPNITSIIQLALIDAQRKILRRPELGGISITTTGSNYTDAGTFRSSFNNQAQTYPNSSGSAFTLTLKQFLDPQDATSIDKEPVFLLALATVKDMLKQSDGKQAMDEFEEYMKGLAMRLPHDAVTFVNNAIRTAQTTLYRMYKVFRMERWFTWTEVANQNFYSMYGDDNAVFAPPTGLTATLGTFGNFGSPSVNRSSVQPALLNDGRVLFAGGQVGSTTVASCEIYDPSTGLFTVVAPMNVARSFHELVVMSNGRVLAFGGSAGSTLSSAEIYDPVANTWSVTGSMINPRLEMASVLLPNGNVLAIAGNYPEFGVQLASMEIYNPSTGVWTLSSAVLGTAIYLHDAILLNNGTVLIAGGANGVTPQNMSYLYTPFSDTVAASGNMVKARYSLTLTRLQDGTIITGGCASLQADSQTAEVYSPVAGTWAATTGQMTVSLLSCSFHVLGDGTIYVYGENFTTIANVGNVYSLTAGTFSSAPASPVYGRRVVLSDGRLMHSGHFSPAGSTVPGAAFYTQAGGWVNSGSLTTGTLYYRVAANNASGSTLASSEVSVAAVSTGFAIDLSCNAVVGATQYNWYGRITGGEQLIGTTTVPAFVDFNTNAPNGALPTASTAAPVYTLDARSVTAVYRSSNQTNWSPIAEGIEPFMYNATTTGPPQRYMIRQALEVWPPPTDATWQIQVRGYFKPLPFSADTDFNSIDPQAIYLKAKIDAEIHYKRGSPDATREELDAYIGHLIAGTHNTRRYVPGGAYLLRDATRPILIGYPY